MTVDDDRKELSLSVHLYQFLITEVSTMPGKQYTIAHYPMEHFESWKRTIQDILKGGC